MPQSDTVVILKNPCAAVRDGETLPASDPPLPLALTHTRARHLPLILQTVSEASLCSISAKASPVIDQLQQNQLRAF